MGRTHSIKTHLSKPQAAAPAFGDNGGRGPGAAQRPVWVSVKGQYDYGELVDLSYRLGRLVPSAGMRLIVDLQDLRSADPEGLDLFMANLVRLSDRGMEIFIVRPVYDVPLRIKREWWNPRFRLLRSRDEARSALRPPGGKRTAARPVQNNGKFVWNRGRPESTS